MSAGAPEISSIVSGAKTAAEAAARQAVYERAQARINSIEAQQGATTAPGSTPPTPSSAGKSAIDRLKSATSPGSLAFDTLPGIGPVAQALGGIANAVESPLAGVVGEAEGAARNAVGEGLVNWIKPVATKLTLYAVFILGAVVMMVFGLSELLKPVGGPSVGDLGRRARAAVAIGAAA